MNKKILPIILLVMVVYIAGCVGNDSETGSTTVQTPQQDRISQQDQIKVFNGTIVSKETIKLTVDEVFGDGWDEEFPHIEIALEDGNYTSGIPDVDPSRLHIGDKITFEHDWLSEYREKERGLRLGDFKFIKIRRMP